MSVCGGRSESTLSDAASAHAPRHVGPNTTGPTPQGPPTLITVEGADTDLLSPVTVVYKGIAMLADVCKVRAEPRADVPLGTTRLCV